MPLQLAGVEVERNDGTAVKIVAAAIVAIPIRTWVSDAPIGKVEVRIIRTGHPNGSAAMFPGIRVRRPGFMTWFARAGNGVKAPGFLSGLCIVGCDETADAVLAAGRADDDFVLHDQRREGHRVAGFRFCHCDVPELL